MIVFLHPTNRGLGRVYFGLEQCQRSLSTVLSFGGAVELHSAQTAQYDHHS